MFNRYWRDYPWWMQIMQFGLMVSIFWFFAPAIEYVIVLVTDISPKLIRDVNENSATKVINAVILLQFVSAIFIFLLPPVLFAYATHPKPMQYIGFRRPGKPIQLGLSALIILGILPVGMMMTGWLNQLSLGGVADEINAQNERITRAMLEMTSVQGFLSTFVTIAILPAISEELFFRGVIFKLSAKRYKNIVAPVLISALCFTLLHGNIYGMPAIFIDGIILAVIYYLTGSLWCSILAHFINNGLQVALAYFGKNNVTIQAINDNNQLPWYMPVAGLLVFAVSMYLLWKNRTPLPADWTDDFAGEVRSDEEESGSY